MKKILLVDDSTTTQKLISITLANEPYQIESVMDSKEALEKINRKNPDIVMVDINMPGMNGFELCREIKARPSTSNIRVVLLFGVFDELNDNQIESVGADATLIKPFETKSLLEVLSSTFLDEPKKLSPNKLASLDISTEKPNEENLKQLPKQPIDLEDLWIDDLKPHNSQDFLQGWKEESIHSKNRTSGIKPLGEPKHFPSRHNEDSHSKKEAQVGDLNPQIISQLMNSPEFKKLIQDQVDKKIEKILWEVIPVTANSVIKSELQKLLNSL